MESKLPHPRIAAFVCALLLSGCMNLETSAQAQTPTEPKPAVTLRLAGVERIEAFVLDTDPVQVRVAVYGWMPDPCTQFHSFDQKVEGDTVKMRIITTRPKDVMCAQVIKRWRETYPVDVEGLAPGTYTLDVNGKQTQITLP